MANPFKSILNWFADNFRKDASKMLICTGVAGWTLSSIAQIGALVSNPKISKEQKNYLIPQEIADAVVNIGAFFLITLLAQKSVAKLFSTGKFAPEKVRAYMKKFPEKYANNVGKVGFDLDKAFANDSKFPKEAYYICKNFYTALATVSAGVVSSNIVTPIVRNNMASKMQKNLMASNENATPKKPLQTQPTFRASYGMRI